MKKMVIVLITALNVIMMSACYQSQTFKEVNPKNNCEIPFITLSEEEFCVLEMNYGQTVLHPKGVELCTSQQEFSQEDFVTYCETSVRPLCDSILLRPMYDFCFVNGKIVKVLFQESKYVPYEIMRDFLAAKRYLTGDYKSTPVPIELLNLADEIYPHSPTWDYSKYVALMLYMDYVGLEYFSMCAFENELAALNPYPENFMTDATMSDEDRRYLWVVQAIWLGDILPQNLNELPALGYTDLNLSLLYNDVGMYQFSQPMEEFFEPAIYTD